MIGKLARSALKYGREHKVNTAFAIWSGVDGYKSSKEEGQSTLAAAGTAAFDMASGVVMGVPGMIAQGLLVDLPTMAIKGHQMYTQYNNKLRTLARQNAFQNAQFNDTEQVHTMRQAGMAIAQRSKYNTQQAMLGNEASYMMK